jgi:formylglycine-generating enzyme required for sulfatase activity
MRLFRIFALHLSLVALGFAATHRAVQADEHQPQKWALLVGVNDYAHLRDLRYASRDMLALGTALASAGFPRDQMVVFHDDAKDAIFKPLKANIERHLSQLTRSIKKGDVLLFGFSGHGLSLGGKTYLCPFEARADNPAVTMIAVEDIVSKLQNSPATSRLIIADACRNNRRSSQQRQSIPPAGFSSLGKMFESTADGIAMLWSCGPEQTSYEEDRFQHGVFTHYVLSGLAGYADGNRDGNVSLSELHQFARRQTTAHVTKTWNDDQTPQKFGKSDDAWAFTRIATAATRPETLASRPITSTTPAETILEASRYKKVFNSIGMMFALIPSGQFVMGSPPKEFHRTAGETQHVVHITRPFYMGMCEVTQSQYRAVMGTNPSWFSSAGGGQARVSGMDTDLFPVENVSWNDAQEFCRRLSQKEGRAYRLPTEAEWEYACRAGSRSAYYAGNAELDLSKAGWYGANLIPAGNSTSRTNRIGLKEPNAFKLYDMHGNVWEWCADWYDADYYSGSPVQDPAGPLTGTARVIRGGGWLRGPRLCRSAYRGQLAPDERQYFTGFRVCVSVAPSP